MRNTLKRAISVLMALAIVLGVFTVVPKIAGAADKDYSSVFNATFYANKYPDLKATYGEDAVKLLNHFKNHGMAEGRQGSAEFDVKAYKARYADLQAAYGDNLKLYYEHYMTCGKKEGRIATAEVATKAEPISKAPTADIPKDAVAFKDGYFLVNVGPTVLDYMNDQRRAYKKNLISWSDTLANNSRTRAREISMVFSNKRPDDSSLDTAYIGDARPVQELQIRLYGVATAQDVINYMSANDVCKDYLNKNGLQKCGISVYTDGKLSYVIVASALNEENKPKN